MTGPTRRPDEASAQERFVSEASKDDRPGEPELPRSPYARDRARVLHSAAFRRLAAKTQVHTADNGDRGFGGEVLRTRLTHSLEVAQIAREMGELLGCDPDVADTAGLAHDLGHPPFGHNGEDALDEVAKACGGFEANAQTLRVLTRLEAKVLGPDGRPAGLNLTRACLDASVKYPWSRRDNNRKFGYYTDDEPVFRWLRAGVADEPPLAVASGVASNPVLLARRSLEAQVMDWADDVAYSVHDVEDGVITGHVRLGLLLRDGDERADLCKDVAEVYSTEPTGELGGVLADLLASPALAAVADFDGSGGALAALKHAASLLIGRFVTAAVEATQERYGAMPLRRYEADLVVPQPIRSQCALLKGMALRYVMRRPGSHARYAQQRDVLRDLVAALVKRAPDGLDPVFGPLWRRAGDDAAKLRVVIDQVASLTDTVAIAWHRRLCGAAAS